MPSDLTGVRERVREIVEPTTFRARLANGATFVSPEEIGDLRALLAALDAAEADTKRLDWLERLAKDGDADEWEVLWYTPLRLRPYVDQALAAALATPQPETPE